jgi:hypothetical protein
MQSLGARISEHDEVRFGSCLPTDRGTQAEVPVLALADHAC